MTDADTKAFAAEAERRRQEGLKMFGKTYDIKEDLKSEGCIWDSHLKCWLAPNVEVASRYGVHKEGKHGGYFLVARGGDNSGAPPAPAQTTTLGHGDLCPACKEETLDAETRPGELICWDCGYRS